MYLENNYDKNDIKYVYDGKEEVSSFNQKGENLGTLKIYYQDNLIDTQTIKLDETLKFNFLNFIKEEFLIIVGVIALIISIIFIKKQAHKKAS